MSQHGDLGVLRYSPLGGGLLTGKYGVDPTPDQGRLVENSLYQTRYEGALIYQVGDRLTEFAEAHGFNPVSLAVAGGMLTPTVTTPIIDGRTLDQLEDSLAALDIDMTDDLYEEISSISLHSLSRQTGSRSNRSTPLENGSLLWIKFESVGER